MVLDFLSCLFSACTLAIALVLVVREIRKSAERASEDRFERQQNPEVPLRPRPSSDEEKDKDFLQGVENIMSFSVNGKTGFDKDDKK